MPRLITPLQSLTLPGDNSNDGLPFIMVAYDVIFDRIIDAIYNYFFMNYPDSEDCFQFINGYSIDFFNEIKAKSVGNSPYDLFLSPNDVFLSQLNSYCVDDVKTFAKVRLSIFSSYFVPNVGPNFTTAASVLSAKGFTGKIVVVDPTNNIVGSATKQVLENFNTNNQYITASGEYNTNNVLVVSNTDVVYNTVNSGSSTTALGITTNNYLYDNTPTKKSIIPDNYCSPVDCSLLTLGTRHAQNDTENGQYFPEIITNFNNFISTDQNFKYSLINYGFETID